MIGRFSPEVLNSLYDAFTQNGYPPEDFSKVIDNDKVFTCPGDKPHPHRINHDRAVTWNFESAAGGYKYSYGIAVAAQGPGKGGKGMSLTDNGRVVENLHKNASGQILVADGVWPWIRNYSGYYVDNPNSAWNQPAWYSNCIGYFHGNSTTVDVLCCDGSVKSQKWGNKGSGIRPERAFFWGVNESVDEYPY